MFKLQTSGYPLFSTFPLLSFLAFFLGFLASAVLNAFLLCRDTWNNVIEWVFDDADRLDFRWAVVEFQAFIV